jgi:hypothetical protein
VANFGRGQGEGSSLATSAKYFWIFSLRPQWRHFDARQSQREFVLVFALTVTFSRKER